MFRGAFLILLVCGLTAFALPAAARAQGVVAVPPGNRHAVQPEIPSGSVSRTLSGKTTFDVKYEKIRDFIASDRKLRRQIKLSAAKFGIDPIHIVGALIGEHTYNVDALDFFQTYFVKAASYLKSAIEFRYDGEKVSDFVRRPEFAPCAAFADSYQLWNCREDVWRATFAGKTVAGRSYPNDRFSKVFFQPLYAGQTFGLGQLNPLTALRATDMVSKVTRAKKLSADNAPEVYATIMAPDTTLDYMAAILRLSIDAYRSHAGVDISGNPGITATLYNLGDVVDRARALGERRRADPALMPEENYYGWLVNDRLAELLPLVR
ncbi:MAG: DUF1402 family protein [Nitratireductor sp.]|nr:DUF1402 family protein [Nitratireductor sp.]